MDSKTVQIPPARGFAGVVEQGVLEFTVEADRGSAQLQVDGNDIVSITGVQDDGYAHITVYASSHPDSPMAWSGTINVRERSCPADCSEETYDPGVACSECGKVWNPLPLGPIEAIETVHWATDDLIEFQEDGQWIWGVVEVVTEQHGFPALLCRLPGTDRRRTFIANRCRLLRRGGKAWAPEGTDEERPPVSLRETWLDGKGF